MCKDSSWDGKVWIRHAKNMQICIRRWPRAMLMTGVDYHRLEKWMKVKPGSRPYIRRRLGLERSVYSTDGCPLFLLFTLWFWLSIVLYWRAIWLLAVCFFLKTYYNEVMCNELFLLKFVACVEIDLEFFINLCIECFLCLLLLCSWLDNVSSKDPLVLVAFLLVLNH